MRRTQAPMETKKTEGDHRTDRIPIRVTPAQKAVLAEAASRSGLDVSSWLRALGMERAAVLGITEATVRVERAKAAPRPRTKGNG